MSKNKNFFFRIDSNKKIGLGHLARCLILAKILKKNCYFIVDSKKNNELFNNLNIKFISLYEHKKFISEISDAKKVNNIIKKFANVYLIIDDYRIGYKWHKYFKNKKVKIIVIDDLVNRRVDADVYLNFKLDHSKEFKERLKKYINNRSIKLIGPKFSILNKNLANKKDNFFNIMLNFGNAFDFNNIDRQVIQIHKIISKKLKNSRLYIPIGNGAKNYKSIIEYSNKQKNFKVIYKKFGISKYLNKVDLFVGSASTAIYEMSFLKTPSIFVVCNKTQSYKISEIEKLGHYFLINLDEFKNQKFLKFLDSFIKNYKSIKILFSQRKAILDNMGANRIAQVIKNL